MKRRADAKERGSARRPHTLVVAIRFLHDLQHWVAVDPRTALRILRIILDIARNPREGIGKPELLKHDRSGNRSRRIDKTHRLLYRVDDEAVEFISARFHYE
ncbi:Txe/YoeB family addiction module toxin [Longimicrobium sp.]|uniref:Txe/YoeB family addiction module toxin n=1 Tax=Longimicrobium sp. TaxID=2029185 RepID=UPI002BE62481|nr:Txe/YoeB family addiction module toxin [Longimicrobium sp.]HSU17445.1 Txe/YoeB family addiction module toxin [Longimicrobium sp.]